MIRKIGRWLYGGTVRLATRIVAATGGSDADGPDKFCVGLVTGAIISHAPFFIWSLINWCLRAIELLVNS